MLAEKTRMIALISLFINIVDKSEGIKAKVWIFKKFFDGFPKEGDLKLAEEELPSLKDGQFLAQAVYLSVDPYMRKDSDTQKLGKTFFGSQIALITESKHSSFPKGKYVVAQFGWRTHTISNGLKQGNLPLEILPDFGDLPLSLALGMAGMPGNTAYFGFVNITEPKPGETIVISGAAGAVGSHVGQLAKIKGLKVIGIAGSNEKGKWLTKDLKFDGFINYKTDDIVARLKDLAPLGVDIYFDNVGGELSSKILNQMKNRGKVAVCGVLSGYNNRSIKAPIVQFSVLEKELKMEGFRVWRWIDRWNEGIKQNLEWLRNGKLQYKETVTEGFDNMFTAFENMLKGNNNVGKAVVKGQTFRTRELGSFLVDKTLLYIY